MLKSFSAARWKENENKNYSMYNLLAQSILSPKDFENRRKTELLAVRGCKEKTECAIIKTIHW